MPKRLFALAGALMLSALPALSQTNPTGTISGKVVDPQGLAVPGVTVTAEAPTLQGTRTATTSAATSSSRRASRLSRRPTPAPTWRR